MMRRGWLALVLLIAACSQAPAPVVQVPAGHREVVVAPGDSVYAIARRHGVSMRGLIEANGLAPPYRLEVGQRLRLPRERVHEVARGETLYEIARRFGVDMTTLARANGLAPPYRLLAGQRLRIPRGEPAVAAVARPAAVVPPATAAAAPPPARAEPVEAAPEPGLAPIPPPKPETGARVRTAAPSRAPAGRFLWPVEGDVIARFGRRPGGLWNEGINIAAPKGAPVRAAADGTVAYVGNELRGYGQLVLIRHPGGWVTAYAHNDAVLVRAGQRVRQGQVIARVGATGRVRTPQSHFEVRRGTEPIDPETVLAQD